MSIKTFLAGRFSLHEDSAHESEIIESITRSVEFRGSNLWSLIFAIFIASIGLNVNSTAVIIGAMLVSPLMGPIMGLGLGLGINDVELIKKALKNLLIAVVISVCVSTLYFLVTPLQDAQSELLARTTPSIWDVFIALFGGLAGIVGGTRKEKSNVIPGVAIATALMPPLCTAGFGIAVGNFYYFVGAFYLFFINSVFICISTFLIVRFLKLQRRVHEDKKREKAVNQVILSIVILTALPSIYLAYNIVQKSIFQKNAGRYIKEEFKFNGSQVISRTLRYESDKREIELILIGEELSDSVIDRLESKMDSYNLNNTKLIIKQGLIAKQEVDLSQVKLSIINEIFSRQSQVKQTKLYADSVTMADINNELKVLFPSIESFSINSATFQRTDSALKDTVVLFVVNCPKAISRPDQAKLEQWLKIKIKADTVNILMQITRR